MCYLAVGDDMLSCNNSSTSVMFYQLFVLFYVRNNASVSWIMLMKFLYAEFNTPGQI